MIVATLLIIVFSHQGCWISQDPNEVSVALAANIPMPPADLHWELLLGDTKVSAGSSPLAQDPQETIVHIVPPKVRIPSKLRWKYTLVTRTGAELEKGEDRIDVFPDSLLDRLSRQVGSNHVVLWQGSADLVKIFDHTKTAYTLNADPIRLSFFKPDVILVGVDALDPSPFVQVSLQKFAGAGASILIFRQRRLAADLGYQLVHRDAPAKLDWLADHPLLRHFDDHILDGIRLSSENSVALRLAADESALAIAAWPGEIAGHDTVQRDCLLVSKTIGKGRIVFCQLPLTDFDHDPRAQIFLLNAMDYLLSPVAIAGRSSEPVGKNIERISAGTITIPPGDR